MVPGFEGGQTPLWKRLPKRGFRNPNRKSYTWINLDLLERTFEAGAEVTPQVLREHGLLKGQKEVKILGRGKLSKGLIVRAHRFSKSAILAIEAAGGQAIQLEPQPKPHMESEERE
jgi:large subunit ribosomal protein L15